MDLKAITATLSVMDVARSGVLRVAVRGRKRPLPVVAEARCVGADRSLVSWISHGGR
jgi:hypothetical protein